MFGAVAVVATLIGVTAWVFVPQNGSPPESDSAPVGGAIQPEQGSNEAEAHLDPATEVDIAVHTTPSGARLSGPGIVPTATPASLRLPVSDQGIELTLQLSGYETHQHVITPTEAQRLEFVLRPQAPRPAEQRWSRTEMRRPPRSQTQDPQRVGLHDIWE